MRNVLLSCSAALATFALSPWLLAATYYVGPEGTGEACTRAAPCALGTGALLAMAGDTVILLDGTYYEPLHPENSGRPDAWITFKADECALPIIEGAGEALVDNEEGNKPSGVASNTGQYLRFIGIVSRHWDSGFTNGWTGEGTTNSNGNFEYINCIGDGNGRTAFAMYSAGNVKIRESIAAHNGGSPTDSWSSGIQLYAVQGTPEENVIERSISFENVDAQKNTDGSGFIVDEHTMGSTFVNNIAFRNGGSCIRLTRSNNTRMINFTCYHNGMNPAAISPTDPGEFYFTDPQSRETAIVINTLAAASGTEADPAVFIFPPESGLSNNVTVDSGPTPFFTDPAGQHPDFRPPASAAQQVENQGSPNYAPEVDIGFDPKCIVQRVPDVPYRHSWWTHSIDYDYIRSIGGVAKCFHPKPRTGGVDVGAYELSGAPHTFSQPGSCVRSPDPVEPEPTEPDSVNPVTPTTDDADTSDGTDVGGGTLDPGPTQPDPSGQPTPVAPVGSEPAPDPNGGGMGGDVSGVPITPNPAPIQPTPGVAPSVTPVGAGSDPTVPDPSAPMNGVPPTAGTGPALPPSGEGSSSGGCRLDRSGQAGGLASACLLAGIAMLGLRRRRVSRR